MIETKLISNGSAFSKEDGDTSLLIKSEDFAMIIDCGGTVSKEIIKNDYLNRYDNLYCLITHMHPDHVGSLGNLIFYCKYKLNNKLTILAVSSMVEDIKMFLKIQGVSENLYNLNTDVLMCYGDCSICCKSIIMKNDELSITYDSVNHVEELESYSYSIKIKNNEREERIYYSGDCVNVSNMLKNE